jgi:hypothetical protein
MTMDGGNQAAASRGGPSPQTPATPCPQIQPRWRLWVLNGREGSGKKRRLRSGLVTREAATNWMAGVREPYARCHRLLDSRRLFYYCCLTPLVGGFPITSWTT